MCTLIVSVQQHPRVPLVIAANRDEVKSRPAQGPTRWAGEPFVAPTDEQAGGSWLGLTTTGLFVGVTNRFPSQKFPERESRGQLVLDALRAPDARTLHQRLSTLSPTRFNTFHLLYADGQHAFVTWTDGDTLHQDVLGPGLHVVTERSLGGDDHSRQSLIREAWPQLAQAQGLPTPEALFGLLALKRGDDGLGGVSVDAPAWNYGTRSALVLFRAEPLSHSRFFWADGPPDRTPFVERPELIASLVGQGPQPPLQR